MGRTVVAKQVTDDEVADELRGFGLPETRIEGILGMARGIRSGFTYENPRSLHTTTPTPLAAWAAEQFPHT
jgi:hypothetical protein